MKLRKLILWLFIGATTYCILLATTDYSKLAFCLLISILIYLGLLKRFADAARVWLCIGGGIGGALVVGGIALSLINLFRDGWNTFGLSIWAGLVLAPVGGVLGFWLVGLLTEPVGNNASSPREEA